MAIYEYDGKFYDLPEGLSKDQAISKIQDHLGTLKETKNVPVAQPAVERSLFDEALRQVGLTARAGYEAFTAPATAVLEAGRSAYNLASGALGSESRLPSFYEQQSKALSSVGLPEPQTGIEKAVQAGTQAMAGTAVGAKMLPNVPAMAADLYRQIPAAAVAGLTGQPVAEEVKARTGSDMAAFLASVGLGAVTAGATGKTIDALQQRKLPLMTAQEVKDRASRSYTAIDEAGITLKPESINKVITDLRAALDEARMVEGTDQAKAVNARLAQMLDVVAKNKPVSFSQFDKMRQMLSDLKSSPDPDIRRLGGVAVSQMDSFVSNLSGKDVLAGADGIDAAVKTLANARKDWRNASRASILEDALNVAEAKQLDPKTSESELIRRGFINIVASKEKMKLFSQEEQNIIRSVAKGGSMDKLLSFAAQFNPLRSKLAAAVGTYGIMQAPGATTAIAGTGLAADLAQGALRRMAAENAAMRIASGETAPTGPNLAYRGLLTGALNPPIE